MKKTTKKSSRKSGAKKSIKKAAAKLSGRKMSSDFRELFMDELRDIYWAEQHLVKALGKLSKAAASEELTGAFEKHMGETEEHVSRLEEVFEILGENPKTKKCEAMSGLLEEANEVMKSTEKGTPVRDAALIIAAQKVEHYEISAYGSLATLAKLMNQSDAADLLGQTLEEEKKADETLTEIAESSVNEEAAAE